MKNIFTASFGDVSIQSQVKAGGKGVALAEMFRNNIPVPPGYVVLTDSLSKCLKNNPTVTSCIEKIKPSFFIDPKKVQKFSKEVRHLIETVDIPNSVSSAIMHEYDKHFSSRKALVAIRSSAVSEDSSETSWAGELESFLNVDYSDILRNVKRCWSSIFTTRALFYRFENKISFTDFRVAVVIQKMVQSEKSGVCFTVNPVNKSRNELTIEAVYGLGEAIVLGHVTPDRYIVDKINKSLLEVDTHEQTKRLVLFKNMNKWRPVPLYLSRKQKLLGKEIISLAKMCETVEHHFRFPCDIEWAYEKGKFYIVQSRPITTLN